MKAQAILLDEGAWWSFCERADVQERLERLNAGTIHPVEYAQSILALAVDASLLAL